MGAQGLCAVISWRLEDLEEARSQFKGNRSHRETCCCLEMQPEARENIPLSLFHWRRDRLPTPVFLGFPCGSAGKESPRNVGDLGLIPGLERSLGEGTQFFWTLVFWPGEFHGLYSPWGHKESDTTSLSLFLLPTLQSPELTESNQKPTDTGVWEKQHAGESRVGQGHDQITRTSHLQRRPF